MKILSLILSLSLIVIYSSAEESHVTEAKNHIRSHLSNYYKNGIDTRIGKTLCQSYTCCNITSGQSCPITSMNQDETTLVLPGGRTRCIFSYSTPFAFQVIPGDRDKLLFYLQGGGACWDETSTKEKLCSTDSSPQSLVGIFDRENSNNQYKDYTIVHVLYCSGDIHGGNTTRPYNDDAGQPIVQVGLDNVQSAVDWVNSQINAKNLNSTFTNFVVMGCSAGSIGAQIWARELLTTFKWKTAAVIPDSYAGIFPEGSMGPLIYDYGFCNSGFLSDELLKKCNAQTLTLQDIDMEYMASLPFIPFSFIQSKTDSVQISFYIAVGISTNSSDKTINPTDFYTEVNDVFGMYNQNPNFVTYLIDGDHHCFTDQSVYYQADTYGPNDSGKTPSDNGMLYSWVNELPLINGQNINTACDGTLQNVEGINDNKYCSTQVVPKSFTEVYKSLKPTVNIH